MVSEPEQLAFADLDVNDVEIEESVEGADDEVFFAGFLEDFLESEIDHGVDVLENFR